MGLTIHYSQGKAKNRLKIDNCIAFLEDVARRLPCENNLIDETLTGLLDNSVVTVHQKGVILFLDEGSEPLTFVFDYDSLEFCQYFNFGNDGTIDKSGFFCKTQYAKNFLRTHHTACKLLETIKREYVRGLRVVDDAEYFGDWNKIKLEKTFERWNNIIVNFAETLNQLTEESGLKFEGAGVELYKDQKLRKLFN